MLAKFCDGRAVFEINFVKPIKQWIYGIISYLFLAAGMEIPKVFQSDFFQLKVHLYILDLIFRNKKTNENNEKLRITRTPTSKIMKKSKTCTQKFNDIILLPMQACKYGKPPMRTKSTGLDNRMCLEVAKCDVSNDNKRSITAENMVHWHSTFASCLCIRSNSSSGNIGMLSGNHVNYIQRPHVQV